MRENVSVRQWQAMYRAGVFDAKDFQTQCAAGWYDWFCSDDALAGRLKKLSKVVLGVTDPFLLDNFYVCFKNNCPLNGPLYDDVRFEPLTGKRGGKYFVVSLDSPHERVKWALVTERYGFDAPEFECGNVRDLLKYINAMGPELEQGILPSFIAEKDAVTEYSKLCGEPPGIHIYREGEHRFGYTSWQDRKQRIVTVAATPEEAPPGFSAEQAVRINGLYVHCPDEPKPDLAVLPPKVPHRTPKRKEPER